MLANDRCRREILDRLRDAGPLQSRELPDTCDKPWASTGWTNNKNVTAAMTAAIDAEIADLARWLGLDLRRAG